MSTWKNTVNVKTSQVFKEPFHNSPLVSLLQPEPFSFLTLNKVCNDPELKRHEQSLKSAGFHSHHASCVTLETRGVM